MSPVPDCASSLNRPTSARELHHARLVAAAETRFKETLGAAITGPIGRDTDDVLIGGNLVEQFGRNGRIPRGAACDLGRAHRQCSLVDPEVELAP